MRNHGTSQEGTSRILSHPKLLAGCDLNEPLRELPADVCRSVGDVLSRVGDKWSVLVIYMLSRRVMRFSELKRGLGSISQKMLTTTLRKLERDGYVTRKVTLSVPLRVDYELTKMGSDALDPVAALAKWALSRRKDIEAARKIFDKKNA